MTGLSMVDAFGREMRIESSERPGCALYLDAPHCHLAAGQVPQLVEAICVAARQPYPVHSEPDPRDVERLAAYIRLHTSAPATPETLARALLRIGFAPKGDV